MERLKSIVLSIIFFFGIGTVMGQFIRLEDSKNIIELKGDEIVNCWSSDSRKLLYQSNKNGNWDIYIYHLLEDSSEQITFSPFNEKNPTWVENDSVIVFDSEQSGLRQLYRLNLNSNSIKLLFDREIEAKQASFSASEELVYFSGFDPLTAKWEIYSYEFKYQNLNQLTHFAFNSHSPAVSHDEDHVVYTQTISNLPYDQLNLMNWYGEENLLLTEVNSKYASWSNTGIKVYFVKENTSGRGDIYSIWLDGTHLEQLTEWDLELKNPIKSPDDKYIAVSIKVKDGFDIYLLPAEDY